MLNILIMCTASANSHVVTCTDLINVMICSYFHRNIALAWLVTVPVSGLISAAAIAILREIAL
jgi:phosphate/sulfate permease